MRGGFIGELYSSGANGWFIFFLLVAVAVIYLIIWFGDKEGFAVPVTPSPEQDKKFVTPAGNVITY